MHLVGSRCIVRSWRSSDAASLVRHANSIGVASQLRDRFPHPYTPAHAEEFLQLLAQNAEASATVAAIEVDNEAAGGIGLTPGADVERYSGEIGYWLGEAHWGRGIVTEAVTLLTAHAFEHLNLLRLFALPFVDNVRSVAVLEKAGYVKEGRLRSSAVKDGQARDQYLYARVNPNWSGPHQR